MRIAIKEVGKELVITDTKQKYRSDCVREFVGQDSTVEFVKMNEDGTFALGVNEDGLAMELPTNFLLGTLNPYFPIQKMVGTVVFVRCKYANPYVEEIWDYEVEDLTEDDLECINLILSGEYQKGLAERFKDYGKGAMHCAVCDVK